MAGLRQETGLLAQNRRQTQLLTRVTRGLGGAFGAVAGVGFGAILLDVARGSVQASVRVEGFRRSLTALYGDAQIAERELDRLREVAQLPGITFEGAVAGALRLKTVGREGADAAAIITEFSNANALAGGTTQEFGRAMVGLTQILSRGKLSQEELNQVLENVPLIGNSIREAFGSIDAENIRAQLSSAGQDVNDFVDILTNQLSMGARASAESTANAFSNLQNATFELSAAFGDILSPAVNTATRGLTAFINRLAEAARGEDEFVQASELFTASLAEAEGNTENTNAAIQAYIDRLTELRTEQENLRDDTPWWRYAGDAPAEIERLTGDIELFTDALKGVPGTQDRVREAFEAARTAYQNQIGVVVDLTDQLENNRLSAGENNDAYQAAQSTLVETRTRFEELLGVMRALGLIDLPQTTDAAADSTANLGESASEATQVYRNFTREIDTASDNVDRWQTALENASTEAEATEAYDNLMQSIMDLTALSRADAEQRTDATALYQAERDEVKALSDAQELHGRRLRGITGDAADAAQAQRRLRAEIHAARVAADTSAETGAMYARILSDIASVSQRRAFVAIVERFQEQGLSLRQALTEAERYIPVLQQRIPDAIETASGSLRDFSITSQDAFQASADSVVNLTGNIIALGGEIREVIREAERLERLDFSDVNASLNEQRYFQQNPGRDVIGEDQRAAGQQGRAYILQNFPEQAAELGITPQTLGEATRATQMADQATQDYVGTLNRSVDAVDQLTPVIEGIFGVDISNPRSGGHLAVDTAQGVGQVLSGNPIGGIATLIRSFYEWGQPDAEALAEQHRQALERERQRVATIQAELDAYDMERENLFAARLDFLRSGESTFSDWTDTLQSFSDTDLVRGRQVFSEFSRAMNALNDEVNAARLGLVPLASSAAFTTLQRITAGRPAFGADLDAPTDAQEAGVVQTIGGVPVNDPEVIAGADTAVDTQEIARILELANRAAERISDNTLRRSIRTSTDTLNGLIRAGNSVAELQAYINETLVPLWEQEYDDMVDDLVTQGHTLEDAQRIVSSEHGTRSEFTAGRTSAIIAPIVEQNQQRADRVAESVSDGRRGREIRTSTDTLGDMIKAGTSIADLQTYINETLVPLWGAEYDDMIDDLVTQGHTLEQATDVIEATHGTRSEFIGERTSAIITPIVEANEATAKRVEEIVSDNTLGRNINSATETLEGLVSAGASVAMLTEFINTDLVPLWGQQYDDMIDDLVTQGYTLEQAEQIVSSQHGTRSEFISGRTSAIITPITEANEARAQQVIEIVSDNQLSGNIQTTTETLNDLITTGASVTDLLAFINTELVPLWEQEYQDFIDDLVAQGYTLEQATQIVTSQHGTVGQFTSRRTDAIIKPITEKNEATAKQVAEIVSDGQLGMDIRTTTETLNGLVASGVPVADLLAFINTELVPLWEQEYQDYIDDLVAQGFTLEQATQIVEATRGTRGAFIGGRTSAIITPITEKNEATARQVAERVSDNTRGREISENTGALQDLVKAGTSIAEIQEHISTELVPLWRSQYQDLIDDLVEQGYTLEQAQALVESQHGSSDEYVAGLVENVLSPIRTSRQTQQTSRARRADRFGIRQARFNLGEATSEGEFDTLFGALQTAIDTFYDNEEERIRGLGLSVEETTRLLEENDLNRREELAGLSRITNTFAQDRINTETRVQMEIEGLRDREFENEQDRLDSLADARQSYQDRLTRIEEEGIRARQDLQRDANRSREDIEREFQDDFREIHRQRVFGEISDEEAARQTQELGRQRLEDLRELGIRTERRQEDLDIREERAIGDAEGRFGRSEQEIIFEAEQQALAITDALTPLLAQQAGDPIAELRSETAMTESATALMEATTAETASATEMTRAETAVTEAGTALAQSEATEAFTTTTDTFSDTVDTFREGVDGLLTVPGLIENAFGVVSTQLTDIHTLTTTIAQRLLIPTAPTPPAFVVEGARNAAAPGSSGGGSDERPIVIENRTTVELEGEKVGQAIGNKIVQQGANRRNALGQAALRR